MYKKQKSKIERINELISLESCKYTHDNIGSMIIKKQLYNEKLIPIISGWQMTVIIENMIVLVTGRKIANKENNTEKNKTFATITLITKGNKTINYIVRVNTNESAIWSIYNTSNSIRKYREKILFLYEIAAWFESSHRETSDASVPKNIADES